MNPFSKDYKPQISPDQLSRRQSESATKRRADGMASDDPLRRIAASGNMGELSSKTNYRLQKSSKL
jgi:hypothetical protein